MKLNEFKAWFDGFTESLEGPPSKKQWERIKEQVAAIDGAPISYPVYVDRYVRRSPWYEAWALSAADGQNADLRAYATSVGNLSGPVNAKGFDGVTAMYAAGKAEALAA